MAVTVDMLRESGRLEKMENLKDFILDAAKEWARQNNVSDHEILAVFVAIGKNIESMISKGESE